MKTILITGGAGAIGSNLTRELLSRGCQITILDNLSSGYLSNLPKKYSQLRLIQGSVTDETILDEVFDCSYDIVFHLAALFACQNSMENIEADLLANGLGTLKMLKRSHQTRVGRFVFSSSSCVYGAKEEILTEDTQRGFYQTPYAMTKALGEDYVQFFHQWHGLPTVILRYFNSYGPREYPGLYRNVIPNFMARAIAGEELIITGSGNETRSFTFVDDIVEATIRAAKVPQTVGEIINIGINQETTIQKLAEKINQIANNKIEIVYTEPRAWDHVKRRRVSIDKARLILDWEPSISLSEGLERTYQWAQGVK